MAAVELVRISDSWASPYAPELYLMGEESLVSMMSGRGGPDVVRGVGIETAKSGNKTYWKLSFGGDWVLVKIPGRLMLEGFLNNRYPVDGMCYLPILPGEKFEGRMSVGKNRRRSVYGAVLTEVGVELTPVDRHTWGEIAGDITGKSLHEPLTFTASPQASADEPEEDGPMAEALRRAGLI